MSRSPLRLTRGLFQKCVRESDGVNVVHFFVLLDGGIDVEKNGHEGFFAGLEFVLREAETLDFRDVRTYAVGRDVEGCHAEEGLVGRVDADIVCEHFFADVERYGDVLRFEVEADAFADVCIKTNDNLAFGDFHLVMVVSDGRVDGAAVSGHAAEPFVQRDGCIGNRHHYANQRAAGEGDDMFVFHGLSS